VEQQRVRLFAPSRGGGVPVAFEVEDAPTEFSFKEIDGSP